MKSEILGIVLLVAFPACARAGATEFAQCGTYDTYVMLYRSVDKLEELGKLRCGEKLEVLVRWPSYSQVRTVDGRVGWVQEADVSEERPPVHREFTFGLSEQPEGAQSKPATGLPNSALTNEDILLMNGLHHGPDFILDKIKSSHCLFDTSPAAIRKLQAAGLSGKVVLAVLETPLPLATPTTDTAETVEVTVPDGTAVELELSGDVSSEELQQGAIVNMSAAEDLVVNGVPIILRGTAARARVIDLRQHAGSGEVAWFMQDIVAINGEHIPATFASKQPNGGRPRNFEGYPFFLTDFHKGGPAIRASDRHFRVVVHGNTILRISQSLATNRPASATKAESLHQIPVPIALQAEATSTQASKGIGVEP